jgi:hypothetical protein
MTFRVTLACNATHKNSQKFFRACICTLTMCNVSVTLKAKRDLNKHVYYHSVPMSKMVTQAHLSSCHVSYLVWRDSISPRSFTRFFRNRKVQDLHSKNHVVKFTTAKIYSVRFQKSIESKILFIFTFNSPSFKSSNSRER